MYLVLIAWFYVAVMMAVAEATSPVGSVLGALVTFSMAFGDVISNCFELSRFSLVDKI